MREVFGNAFELLVTSEFDALCITTNGFVKNDGTAVMGRGIALEVQRYVLEMPVILGRAIKRYGNHVSPLLYTKLENWLLSFPVKHNWWEEADINLIKRSCLELSKEMDRFCIRSCLLPRPGCGNGKLNWTDVRPVIEPLLDDRVAIVHWSK